MEIINVSPDRIVPKALLCVLPNLSRDPWIFSWINQIAKKLIGFLERMILFFWEGVVTLSPISLRNFHGSVRQGSIYVVQDQELLQGTSGQR